MRSKYWMFATLFALAAAGCSTQPQQQGRMMNHGGQHMQGGHQMHGGMAKMDANGDGAISKDEFMKAHEAMFDRMAKDGVLEGRSGKKITKQEFMSGHEKMFDRMANKEGVISAGGGMQCPMMEGGHMQKHKMMGGART